MNTEINTISEKELEEARKNNTNIDLKSDLGDPNGGGPKGGGFVPPHTRQDKESKKEDFWDYLIDLNAEWVIEMLEKLVEQLVANNDRQNAIYILGEIDRIKKRQEEHTHSMGR